ncbi:hypothetical protein HID58_034859, partial [Brassica napus]
LAWAHASNPQQRNALESEFQALLFAMIKCWSNGYRNLQTGYNGKQSLKMLNSVGQTDFPIHTDNLAKHAIPSLSSFHFYSFVPNFISSALSNDFFDY